MHYAGEVPNNQAIVRLLVQYGALNAHVRPPDDLMRQFLAAVFLADAERVRSLVSRHPRLITTPDGRGDRSIHHAARNGDAEIVQLLLQNGADVNATTPRGHTVWYFAGGHGHLGTLQHFTDRPIEQLATPFAASPRCWIRARRSGCGVARRLRPSGPQSRCRDSFPRCCMKAWCWSTAGW